MFQSEVVFQCIEYTAVSSTTLNPMDYASCSDLSIRSCHQSARMFTCDQVMPFPCLATKKCKSSKDRPRIHFTNAFPISLMPCMNPKHHRNRTDDQNKCHYTHKCQGRFVAPAPGNVLNTTFGIGQYFAEKRIVP